MSEQFTLGDYTLMEVALVQFFKDMDVSINAGAQVQELIGKIEIQIGKLKHAATEQRGAGNQDPAGLLPKE